MRKPRITKADYIERILRREFKERYPSRWLAGTPANKRSKQLRRMTSLDLFPIAYPQYKNYIRG